MVPPLGVVEAERILDFVPRKYARVEHAACRVYELPCILGAACALLPQQPVLELGEHVIERGTAHRRGGVGLTGSAGCPSLALTSLLCPTPWATLQYVYCSTLEPLVESSLRGVLSRAASRREATSRSISAMR